MSHRFGSPPGVASFCSCPYSCPWARSPWLVMPLARWLSSMCSMRDRSLGDVELGIELPSDFLAWIDSDPVRQHTSTVAVRIRCRFFLPFAPWRSIWEIRPSTVPSACIAFAVAGSWAGWIARPRADGDVGQPGDDLPDISSSLLVLECPGDPGPDRTRILIAHLMSTIT